MDLCSKLFSTCVMMLTLLGAAHYTSSDKLNCPCPGIPHKNLTEPPQNTCFHINDTFRYTCIRGYLRKAGTSSRTKCKQTNGVAEWTKPSLKCIPDPKKTNTEPTYRVTEGPTDIPHDSIISTTVSEFSAAASTSLQMTQSSGSSVSVTAETDSTEPTSPGLQVLSDLSQATGRTTSTSTSTTTKPPDNRTLNPQISDQKLSSTNTALVALASLVFISALIGISCFYHRRRSKRNNTQPQLEEQIPMNDQSP